jgi:hypothetical protein
MQKTFAAFLLSCLLPACSPSEAEKIRAEQEKLADLRNRCAQTIVRADVAAKLQVTEPEIKIIKDSYDRFKSISLKIRVKNISPDPISDVSYVLVLRNPQGQIAYTEHIIEGPQSYAPGEARIHILYVRASRVPLMILQKTLTGEGYSARCEVESMRYADRKMITGFGGYATFDFSFVLNQAGPSEKVPFALMGNQDNTCSYNGKPVKPTESYQDKENAKEAELKIQSQELAAMRQAAQEKAARMFQAITATARLDPNYNGQNPPIFITVRNGLGKPISYPAWKVTFYDGEALVFTINNAWTRWQIGGGETAKLAYTQAEGSYPLGNGELMKASRVAKVELNSFTYDGKKIDRDGGEIVPEIFRREWK